MLLKAIQRSARKVVGLLRCTVKYALDLFLDIHEGGQSERGVLGLVVVVLGETRAEVIARRRRRNLA